MKYIPLMTGNVNGL